MPPVYRYSKRLEISAFVFVPNHNVFSKFQGRES